MKNIICIIFGTILMVSGMLIINNEITNIRNSCEATLQYRKEIAVQLESQNQIEDILETPEHLGDSIVKIPDAIPIQSVNFLRNNIKIDGTHIDYPIVQYTNNDYYQHYNYLGEKDVYGAIFMDYRNHSDYIDPYTIIYGHNSLHNIMFSDLKKLKGNENIIITYHNKDYQFEIRAISIVQEDSIIYDLIDFESMKMELKSHSSYFTEIDDHVILLSTCYGRRGTNKRLIVAINQKE